MMLRRIRWFIFLGVLGCFSFYWCSCKSGIVRHHEGKTNNDSLARFPYWIAMMDSPGVNYNAAVTAFEKYWEHRVRPTEDDGEGQDIYGKEKSKEAKEKEANRSVQYVYEYKQFLNWQQRNKNLVKPDGTILTPEEILEQWKKSQNDTIQR